MLFLYSEKDLIDNQQFKQKLTDFFSQIDRPQSHSSKILEELNSTASRLLTQISDENEISHRTNLIKRKFQILIAQQALTANFGLPLNSISQHPVGENQDREVITTGFNNQPGSNLPQDFDFSRNSAHQSFLDSIFKDDFYSENFAYQAGQNLDQFIQHLFFNTNSEELRELLGETRFNELQAKLSNSSLDCLPAGDPNAPAYFVTPNTLGNPGENKIGALLHDNALNIGIFNGVNLKLGLRINADGSKEQGLFDNHSKLLIDHQPLIAMYKESNINSDSLVSSIAKFGNLNNSGNGQCSSIESDTTFSLRCLNGKWYLGIFQNKQDEQGNNQLEFRGAIKINDINTIIKIPESTTQSNLDQTIQKERNKQGTQNLEKVNPFGWTTFQSDSGIENDPALTRASSNISLVGSDSSSRNSLDGIQSINSSTEYESRKLLSSEDGDAPKINCCCGLFSRVTRRNLGERFSEFRRDFIEPLGKIIPLKAFTLKNFQNAISAFSRNR